jgi:hypothetical protein
MEVAQFLRDRPDAQHVVGDALEVAEALHCAGVSVLWDCRTFPADSLLLPAFAALQGPALLLHFRDIELSREEVLQLVDVSVSKVRLGEYGVHTCRRL